MDNPEKPATLSTHDTRQTTQDKQNKKHTTKRSYLKDEQHKLHQNLS
jgi:hypothetical protein